MKRKDSPRPVRAERGGSAGDGSDGGSDDSIRLNRYIARSGICSRRKADELISAGKVRINGKTVTELGTRVAEGDEVVVNGTTISPTKHVHILLNKPRNTITTTSDERDRKTVLDLVRIPERDQLGLFPVGRLDRDTTGVLVITNDGELANRLMHPRYEIEKIYVLRADRPVSPEDLDRLRNGVELDGETVRADQVAYQDPTDQRVVGISLHEGRNRQIRRMMQSVGYRVERLERVRYAGLSTSGLRRGRWRRLEPHEVQTLYSKVKLKTK